EFGKGLGNQLNTFSGSPPSLQPQNLYNLGAEWALAPVNTPLRFTGTWTYGLPFGKGNPWLKSSGVVNAIVGGWLLNGTVIYQMGFPLFVYQQNLNSVIGAAVQRPYATGINPATSGSLEERMNNYIDPAAFSQAPAFTFGNLSRSIGVRGPGQANWDLSLFKDFKVRERFTGEFRCEALNAFNTPLFANPNTLYTPTSASFGKITYQA